MHRLQLRSSSLVFPFLALLALGCTAPGATDEDDPVGNGPNQGSGGGDGDGDGDGDIVTVKPPPVENPCEQEDAPENCVLEAPPACGDGEINLDPPEACDDGNSTPGDGCSGACRLEPYSECPTPGQPCISTIICGDAAVGPGEACDDGNAVAGDGCSADCKVVEQGYSCRLQGQPCIRVYVCGDGSVDPNEGCDDGAVMPGDGCDERCRVEIGHKCEGNPSVCTTTVCGDGKKEGAESCDDGNALPFDGCDDQCQAEPECPEGSSCKSSCGDGIVLDEACDDGNQRNGDGCSSACQIEEGFVCTEGSCEEVNGECTLRVSGLFRDFTSDTVSSDFPGSTCNLTTGLVGEELVDGKPVFVGNSCIKSQTTFAQWYTDNDKNRTMPGHIILFDDGAGNFVNRLTNEGHRFIAPSAQATDTTQPCDPADITCLPCRYVPTQTCARVEMDGNPVFFPLDDFANAWPDARLPAKVPQQVYGADGWPLESEWAYWPEGFVPRATHNFWFTSEVGYWFRYEAGAAATLEFVGDDDMWVFINGHLAVDLGGVHTPEVGSVTLDAARAAEFELVDGEVYPIKMFHAERKDPGSSFRLTLSGFTTGRSDCVTDCGDGEVGPGEECDDGPGNLGGYNQCSADCTLGPRCGDGVTQVDEACDYGDGNNTGEYGGCAATCQLGPHCGDGLKSAEEECDNGVNAGGYGECAPGCVLGPVCGDGGFEPAYEECDDGNNIDQDGCSAGCKIEIVVVR